MTTSEALRVLVDLTRLRPGGEGGGITPALHGILSWLGRKPDANIQFVYVTDPIICEIPSAWLRTHDRIVNAQNAPADLAAREGCHLVYCPFGVTNFACPGIPTITLIVDLLHRDFPASLSMADRRYREECLLTALEHSDLFQVISDYTSTQLQKHYNVSADRIFRTYLPIWQRLQAPKQTAKSSHTTEYFFYPANAWVHKNHETLLVAYAIYRQNRPKDGWRLVLTGHPNESMKKLRGLALTLRISNDVDILGYVDDVTLATIWDSAGALVFPSLHEGFGLPLLEAMHRGVPILASDATAIPEITQTAALLVDARSPLSLAQGMQIISTDRNERMQLVASGQARLTAFSPEIEFGRLLQMFSTAANRTSRWRSTGYHPVDGLAEQVSIFALPPCTGQLWLSFAAKPLGVSRTVEFWSDNRLIAKKEVAADVTTEERIPLPANAKNLTLRVPNATRLSDSDPRTHGVLLKRLQVEVTNEYEMDLLAPPPTP